LDWSSKTRGGWDVEMAECIIVEMDLSSLNLSDLM
jgi:hypothetical protein